MTSSANRNVRVLHFYPFIVIQIHSSIVRPFPTLNNAARTCHRTFFFQRINPTYLPNLLNLQPFRLVEGRLLRTPKSFALQNNFGEEGNNSKQVRRNSKWKISLTPSPGHRNSQIYFDYYFFLIIIAVVVSSFFFVIYLDINWSNIFKNFLFQNFIKWS